MLIDAIQTLFDYNTWATARVFDQASNLSPEQFGSVENSGASVHALLFHIVIAQALWLTRCKEITPLSAVEIDQVPNCLTLRHYWEEVDQESHAFLQLLDPPALQRIIYYMNQGVANAYPLWHILYHQINHAAQHRSELAMILTHFGYSPGWLDFLYYVDLRDGTTLHT